MAIRYGLILIDLQNDFLSPSGGFKVDSTAQENLISTLKELVPAFRALGGHVIWVLSEYPLATKERKADVEASTSQSQFTNQETTSKFDHHLEWVL